MSKLRDKINGIFAKAADEATKVVDEGGEEKKEDKAKDADMPAWADKFMKDVMTSVSSMSQPSKSADVDKEDDKDKKAADADPAEKKDDKKAAADEEGAEGDRLSKLEAKVDKLMSMMSGDAAEGEEEEAADAEGEEEESEDDDFEETPAAQVGDEASRIEILAPGLRAKGKDAKRAALETAYKSKDHKAIIETLNGGKPVDFKKASAKTIDHLFVGASEVIGLYRTKDFTKWKQVRDSSAQIEGAEVMTAEKQNEINAKFYKEQGVH